MLIVYFSFLFILKYMTFLIMAAKCNHLSFECVLGKQVLFQCVGLYFKEKGPKMKFKLL